MGTKNNPGAFDCYGNAKPDEPMFVLLGRDPVAPALVMLWAILRQQLFVLSDDEVAQIEEATECAIAMGDYCKSIGKVPVVSESLGAFLAQQTGVSLEAIATLLPAKDKQS